MVTLRFSAFPEPFPESINKTKYDSNKALTSLIPFNLKLTFPNNRLRKEEIERRKKFSYETNLWMENSFHFFIPSGDSPMHILKWISWMSHKFNWTSQSHLQSLKYWFYLNYEWTANVCRFTKFFNQISQLILHGNT